MCQASVRTVVGVLVATLQVAGCAHTIPEPEPVPGEFRRLIGEYAARLDSDGVSTFTIDVPKLPGSAIVEMRFRRTSTAVRSFDLRDGLGVPVGKWWTPEFGPKGAVRWQSHFRGVKTPGRWRLKLLGEPEAAFTLALYVSPFVGGCGGHVPVPEMKELIAEVLRPEIGEPITDHKAANSHGR